LGTTTREFKRSAIGNERKTAPWGDEVDRVLQSSRLETESIYERKRPEGKAAGDLPTSYEKIGSQDTSSKMESVSGKVSKIAASVRIL